MKKRRHAKILELINSHDIETQEELQAFLLKNGYEVTQATISRDLCGWFDFSMGECGQYEK